MKLRLTLRGFLLFLLGGSAYTVGGTLSMIGQWLPGILPPGLENSGHWLLHYSILPVGIGIGMVLFDLLLLKKNERKVSYSALEQNEKLTVVLTAYNDEESIADAVKDFSSHPKVARVVVVSNNSSDKTMERASEAGAVVFNEEKQGYGACVHRALSEGIRFEDTRLVLLCEGDSTFKAYDIDKFLSYIPHADIVNGSRIVEQLRAAHTQLTTFMYYGNFFVGKLLEMKHIENGTLTDVGTTYKLCKKEVLEKLLPLLDPGVNLEFNPYFLDRALHNQYRIVECPITFHPRVGISKGGNQNNFVALKLGLRMIIGITIGWKILGARK